MTFYEKVVRVYTEDIKEIEAEDCASFEKPSICGYFSVDKDRKYVPNLSNMLYFYPRSNKDNLDLNEGIEKVVRKGQLYEKLDHLLEFITNNVDGLLHRSDTTKRKRLETDFVCYRGLLTKILCSIYLDNNNNRWTVNATQWNGTIYLCEENLPETLYISQNEMNKFCSWGYKFEQYMLTDKLGQSPDTSKPVCEPEEFCCIFKSKIGSYRLLYGAEMDGVCSNKEIDESNIDWNNIEFIELKTSKIVCSRKDERNLQFYKFIKWWAQCYLVNIQELFCGFRDEKGIVRQIQKYKIKDLSKQCQGAWEWMPCLNFCKIFLDIVKSTIPADTNDPYTVWKFKWKPFQHQFTTEEIRGQSPDTFLPNWYIDSMKTSFYNDTK